MLPQMSVLPTPPPPTLEEFFSPHYLIHILLTHTLTLTFALYLLYILMKQNQLPMNEMQRWEFTYCETVFYIQILKNLIYSSVAKLNFQHHKPSLQCHMILQEINLICWFAAQETFLIISNVTVRLYHEECKNKKKNQFEDNNVATTAGV